MTQRDAVYTEERDFCFSQHERCRRLHPWRLWRVSQGCFFVASGHGVGNLLDGRDGLACPLDECFDRLGRGGREAVLMELGSAREDVGVCVLLYLSFVCCTHDVRLGTDVTPVGVPGLDGMCNDLGEVFHLAARQSG